VFQLWLAPSWLGGCSADLGSLRKIDAPFNPLARLLHLTNFNMNGGPQRFGAKLLCAVLLFAAAPHSFAIIRSPYPAKSLPPYRGQMIITEGDSNVTPAKSASTKPAK
jgi:hypothetical protein